MRPCFRAVDLIHPERAATTRLKAKRPSRSVSRNRGRRNIDSSLRRRQQEASSRIGNSRRLSGLPLTSPDSTERHPATLRPADLRRRHRQSVTQGDRDSGDQCGATIGQPHAPVRGKAPVERHCCADDTDLIDSEARRVRYESRPAGAPETSAELSATPETRSFRTMTWFIHAAHPPRTTRLSLRPASSFRTMTQSCNSSTYPAAQMAPRGVKKPASHASMPPLPPSTSRISTAVLESRISAPMTVEVDDLRVKVYEVLQGTVDPPDRHACVDLMTD